MLAAHGCEPELDPLPHHGREVPSGPSQTTTISLRSLRWPLATTLLDGGLAVGPVLDHRTSPFLTLADHRCPEWVSYLIQERRLPSIVVAPPFGPVFPLRFPMVFESSLPGPLALLCP